MEDLEVYNFSMINEFSFFDALLLGRDEFYNYVDGYYFKTYGVNIQINNMDIDFIQDGINIKLTNWQLV